MSDTTIKVDSAVRDRLAVLAADRGITIRALVTSLAHATPTRDELTSRQRAAASYVRDRLRSDFDEADLAAGEEIWQRLEAEQSPSSPTRPVTDPTASGQGPSQARVA